MFLLKNKVVSLIKGYFECVPVLCNNSIIFTFKETTFKVYGYLFIYEVFINSKIVFRGNYNSLKGFLFAVKEYYKANELRLLNPATVVLSKINTLIDTEKTDINSLKGANHSLTKLNESLRNKIDTYKSEITKLNKSLESKSQIIKERDKSIENLQKDCEEAADLIETLYYKKDELLDRTKRYKVDHFPKDVQEFIRDIIKEYYNK